MKISIVILNWNRPEDTKKSVYSCLSQQHNDFDVLIWDNASSDQSVAILQQEFNHDSRVRIIRADANYGVAGGRNRAFRACDNPFIVSIDNDVWFTSDTALTLIEKAFRESENIGAISFEVVRPDGHLMWPFARPSATYRHHQFEAFRVDGGACAMRARAFRDAGGFAEHFSPYGAEDAHFAYGLIHHGYRILYCPQISVIHAFSRAARSPLQFRMHVRNLLWIPMERFPALHAVGALMRRAAELWQDARTQHQQRAFLLGIRDALFGFEWKRRQPVSATAWRHIRHLVKIDKEKAAAH